MVAAPRSLPVCDWPASDREAWERECIPGARLRRGGRAGHLRRVPRDVLARRSGMFLVFLPRSGCLNKRAMAGTHVPAANVEAYAGELRTRVSSVTLHGSVCKLRQ